MPEIVRIPLLTLFGSKADGLHISRISMFSGAVEGKPLGGDLYLEVSSELLNVISADQGARATMMVENRSAIAREHSARAAANRTKHSEDRKRRCQEAADEVWRRNSHLSKIAVARILFARDPATFGSIDAIRRAIRKPRMD
jgi:hypothetical protein